MKEIIFATNNKHKLEEISRIFDDKYKILSLNDIGFSVDIPETGTTLKENAIQKAKFIFDRYNVDCFADDTGLEVDALNGAPGVYSARYAGEGCSYNDNVVKLLKAMEGKKNRTAAFKTVIALILNRELHFFEGKIEGEIIETVHGDGGFGYDPIFLPKGYDQTFAEMELSLKNKISHRALATQKLIRFLSEK